MDLVYLEKLNAHVKEGKITPADKDWLWKSYLGRLENMDSLERARLRERELLRYSFVAPMF